MASDDKQTPDPTTPALLSAARPVLAWTKQDEIQGRPDEWEAYAGPYRLRVERRGENDYQDADGNGTPHPDLVTAQLAAEALCRARLPLNMAGDQRALDALTPPADREQGGRLVREVRIAWAKEQPSPKPSWLVPWEDLSEPDKEVDRRIAEACFARARAGLQATAPSDGGEALYRKLMWETDIDDVSARQKSVALQMLARGLAAGRSEGEAERALLREALATSTAELAEARADQQKLIDECARKNETIGKLTNERERAHRDEKQRIVDAIQARLDEESEPDAEGAFCEAIAIARNGEGDLTPAEDHAEALDAARIEGARVEREALDLYLLAAYQETGYEGPVASALSDALDWLRARGAGGAG